MENSVWVKMVNFKTAANFDQILGRKIDFDLFFLKKNSEIFDQLIYISLMFCRIAARAPYQTSNHMEALGKPGESTPWLTLASKSLQDESDSDSSSSFVLF